MGSALTDPLTSPLTVTVADYPSLATIGTAVKVWAGPKTPVGLIQTGLGNFEAFSLTCPHQGEIVGVGSGAAPFGCPGHGAQFNENGQWVGGQQTGNLTRYAISFDPTAGTITVQP
jgi:Rieske Fe-S protein